ncbi:hypothetical protein [Sphingomonas crusticola]|uniref:hypothetical protein n=1 Tax=Sphingomonas crusticola TaxID=1697973 RepID=UPI000E252D2A|nr:hypothetical protein [Sphingomonas crusticola]
MTLLEKMDRAVYATGIDRLVFMKVKPRTLRWSPLLVIAAMAVGYVLLAQPILPHVTHFMAGVGLFYGGYLGAFIFRIFGPRMVPSIDGPLDERELMVKARAGAVSSIILTVLAMAGCFYMAVAVPLGAWRPHDPNHWVALAFAFQACFMLLPTLIASWLQPPAVADDED